MLFEKITKNSITHTTYEPITNAHPPRTDKYFRKHRAVQIEDQEFPSDLFKKIYNR